MPKALRHRATAVGLAALALFGFLTLFETPSLAKPPREHCLGAGALDFEPTRVAQFVETYRKSTFQFASAKRDLKLDQRIAAASLGLGDKVAALESLSPRAEDSLLGAATGRRVERRMERLMLSVAPADLALFKLALDYDGDYKDMEEYVFHDIDDEERRDRLLEHFRTAPPAGIKVLTDVDDTLYANLVDQRYPKKTRYPGVVEFYAALAVEPFESSRTPITTLSARPNPIGGKLEEGSLEKLADFTEGRLCPSGLSGSLLSSAIGTLETLGRANLDFLSDVVPDGKEREIGEVKYANFLRYSQVYPDYRFVFVGDSGQADALTARRMLSGPEGAAGRVLTTFIHDLRASESDARSASASFRELPLSALVSSASADGRGVIVFRNYIAAALLTHHHASTLGGLMTDGELLGITRAALEEFSRIDFAEQAARARLLSQYRQDAEEVLRILSESGEAAVERQSDLDAIQRILDDDL